MKQYESKADFIGILLVIFTVIAIILSYYMSAGLTWVQISLHSFFETLGVFAGFTLALLLLIRQKQHNHDSYYILFLSALISMCILDGFHATGMPGNNFVWLHSIAVLSGGFLVFMVLFSKRINISHDIITLPTVTAFVAVIIGGLSVAFPEAIPAMLSDGSFTFTASAINMIGGILFFGATIYFLRDQGHQERENIFFAFFCLLNGLAALLFTFSNIWDAEWWLWHLLRVTAYFILLAYVFVMYMQTDKALRESENRLKSAMDLAKLVHWEYDVDSDMFTFDDRFYALYGTSADKEGGNKMSSEAYASKFIPPEESALVGKEVAKALETDDPNYVSTLDHKIIRADGEERYITVSIRVIKDAEGRTIKTYGANQDITERKQAEKALQESEEKYRNLVERANDGITIIQDELIKYGNPRLAEMLGSTVEEFIGASFRDYVHPAEISNVYEHYRKRMTGEDLPSTYETVLKHKDGGDVYVELNAGLITYKGQPANLVIVRDVSDRKRAEEALQESEERFKQVAESAGEWIWEVDADGLYTYASPGLEKMLGYKPEEVVGRMHFYDLFAPEEREELKNAALEAFSLQEPFKGLVNINLHKNGSKIILETSGTPILDEKGKLLGYRGADTDITERKRAEEALLASEEKYRKLFEDAVDGIAIADIHTGELIDCNKALAKLVERDKSELIGQHQSILHPKEHLVGKFTKTFSQHVLNREGMVLETQVITKTGIIKDVEIKANSFEIEGRELLQGIFHDITDRKIAEKRLKLHQNRLNISLELHKMSDASQKEILDYVLEACLKTVESEYAFIGLMNEDETVLSIHLWSEDVMKECTLSETPIHFPLSGAGMWGECVRQRRPIMVNDYATSKLYKKGYPEGHVHLKRFLAVPVFDGERIVAVALAANKKEEYDNDDLIAFNSLLNDMWKLIQRKNSENQLIESLKEKEVLLSEIHHRVKNNLQIITSLLNLQSQNLKNEYYIEVFRESQNRVKSMALIHERLYQTKDFANINMAEHIKKLASGLFNTYRVDQNVVRLNTNIQDVKFNMETAIPLSLIINELVTNSIKHAFPKGQNGEINIDLVETDEKSYKLTIGDNGMGIPPDIELEKTGTLGLKLVNNLTNQLDGTIKLDRSRGTQFEIEFSELIYAERI